MSDPTSTSPRRFCGACGSPVAPGAHFCVKCGTRQVAVADQEAAPAPQETAAAAPAPPAPVANHGFRVTLVDPGPYRGRVVLVLRQLLGLDGASAGRYVTAAPAVLAVGLAADAAERLRATLVGAGAAVEVQGPPAPAQVVAPQPARPQPTGSMSVTARFVREREPRRGPRTLTGLVVGRGCSYLAYGRAQASRLLAPPDFIRLDARTMVPTAVRLAGAGTTELAGNRALQSWVQEPGEVSQGFTEELARGDGAAMDAARAFLKFLSYRLVEVLGPGAVDPGEGAATALGIAPDWPEDHAAALAEAVGQAGFPLVQMVPEPLAAVASNLARTPREPEYFLVIDWGSQGLDLSVVENAAAGPAVIDHVEHPLGGIWFDVILEGWLAERLQAELSDEDRRALALFARQFKEEASVSFAEGRAEHVQYCVLPAGMPPTRISVSKAELDDMFADARAQFETAVAEAPGHVGFRPDHFDQVILAGGAARLYFARDAVRAALGRSPLAPPNPEETIARGLVFWGAR